MKKNKKEEVSSRREFFKKVTKKVLPILGALVVSIPIINKTDEVRAATNTTGCGEHSCTNSCRGGCTSCSGSCSGTCNGGCLHTCNDRCTGTCNGGCLHTCNDRCYGTCRGGCTVSGANR